THVTTSHCFHFLDATWQAYMERFGLRIKLDMRRPGFYPRGGGEIHAVIQPCRKIKALTLTKRPALTRAAGFSARAGLPEHIALRQARRAEYRLRARGIDADLELHEWPGAPGSVLAI